MDTPERSWCNGRLAWIIDGSERYRFSLDRFSLQSVGLRGHPGYRDLTVEVTGSASSEADPASPTLLARLADHSGLDFGPFCNSRSYVSVVSCSEPFAVHDEILPPRPKSLGGPWRRAGQADGLLLWWKSG